jgi:hypothetical protein
MRDERLALFLQQFDEAGFLGDQGFDAGGFAVNSLGQLWCCSVILWKVAGRHEAKRSNADILAETVLV